MPGTSQTERLRALKIRSGAALRQAVPEALSTVSSHNAANHFRQCSAGAVALMTESLIRKVIRASELVAEKSRHHARGFA
jgi:hypothetical protein